ncbi:hypothetical protein [Jeongeupia chitinilytica]|uniref:Uncharacterized protein n=1 Tax=Jeongeupia chitinilytica TaxID=1041641 RepID=A0ABQ3GX90_9NEIS|nr:hypothetical protein [Jeongeupia chitinilytica]GHD59707.1 hypothetical protein GCM10007350_11320 [Jeongeupia chitinilytica]
MEIIRELLANAQATSSLQRKYYWMTSAVGLLALATSLLMMMFVATLLASWLGLSWNARIQGSANGVVWVALTLLSVPLVVYVSGMAVAWLSTFPMRWFGAMTVQDVKFYAQRGRYPKHWFKR